MSVGWELPQGFQDHVELNRVNAKELILSAQKRNMLIRNNMAGEIDSDEDFVKTDDDLQTVLLERIDDMSEPNLVEMAEQMRRKIQEGRATNHAYQNSQQIFRTD